MPAETITFYDKEGFISHLNIHIIMTRQKQLNPHGRRSVHLLIGVTCTIVDSSKWVGLVDTGKYRRGCNKEFYLDIWM